ncbi:hypothetical protein HHK36_029148 [Tetracentron sinense]|uniref:Cytochrome b561 and DOMON domain-containing protein n=1 Tax=Tetracentron sinense TaxID=13715 RepID=A0A834YHG6_TETSI|nr:hypothetical protein HHK36_029148 [Tetracentron sinense]
MADSSSRVSPLRFVCVFSVLIFFFEPKIFSVVAYDGDGEPDLCNANLTSFLPAPYHDSSSTICTPVWNTFVSHFSNIPHYLLQSSQGLDQVQTIVLSAVYTTGWVGMGFSKDGMMVGSSAIVGWLDEEGRTSLKQYYLQGSTELEVIADKGKLQFTSVPPFAVLHGATIYLAFQLKFAVPLTKQPIILAYGSAIPTHNYLSHHDDKTTIILDFSAGSASLASNNTDELKRNHGVLGIIGWGVILPSGTIVARYYKNRDPQWYYLHIAIQSLGFIIGLAGTVAGMRLYGKLHANVSTHRGIGILVAVLSILQVMALFLRPKKDSKSRKYWNWYHHWVGRFVLFFGALNILLGIQAGGGGRVWNLGYGFLLAIILIIIIVLESLLWIRGTEKPVRPPAFQMSSI